jgi:hypothetical protein
MEKILNAKTLHILENSIGKNSMKYFMKSKTFFSSLIYSQNNYQSGNLILKNMGSQAQLIEDWVVYMILRSHCRTWIISGKNLRDERDVDTHKNLNFYGYDDIEKYFHVGNEYIKWTHMEKLTNEVKSRYNYKRNGFIISNKMQLSDLYDIEFFREKYCKKYVMINENLNNEILLHSDKVQLYKYFNDNQINIIFDKIKSVEDCINYCKTKIKSEPILIEAGTMTMNKYLGDSHTKNPSDVIDFLLVSVFNGELNADCIGPNFISMSELQRGGYELINVSEKIESQKGYLTFYTFINKYKNFDY